MSIIVWGKMEDSLAGYNVTTIGQPHPDRAGAKMIEMLLALQAGTPPEQLQSPVATCLDTGETVGQVKIKLDLQAQKQKRA